MSTPASWCSPDQPVPPVPRRTAEERGISFSSLCTLGLQALALTGLFRDMLIRHFSRPSQIETQDLRPFIWKDGPDTGILIESIHRWRGELVEKRPAVVVKRNTYRNLRLGIGDRMVGVDARGMVRYSTHWLGSHTLFCIHGSGAAAEILSAEVSREMHRFGHVLVDQIGLLHRWAVVEVGAVSEIEEARESFAVPVTVAWAYEDAWTVNLESLKLRKVPLHILLDGEVLSETR